MPPALFAAVSKLHVGQISPPIRTRLGFHIVQLTDSKPVQQLPFDQARAEIAAALESEKRKQAIKALIVDLCARAQWFGETLGNRIANFWLRDRTFRLTLISHW
jgi:parvulin-like peptidyl-prolyl isomerase